MGGSAGKGAKSPSVAADTISSAQRVKSLHAISEGALSGFGNETLLKSVYLNDTPIQNSDGSWNFKGVTAVYQEGTPTQSYLPEFESTERITNVGAAVKAGTPITRLISDSLVDELIVTLSIDRNFAVNSKGDSNPTTTIIQVDLLKPDNSIHKSGVLKFTEKSSGAYSLDLVFNDLPPAPFRLRATRVTPNATDDKTINATNFVSYVEVIKQKFNHPYTAILGLEFNSEQFGSSLPKVNILVKGMQIKIPSNYNSETRVYTGVWDGTFKMGWTNNPAWIIYDIATQSRYSGIAKRLNVNDIDKWSLYAVSKYCDELVDNGIGGKEPRFQCNIHLSNNRPMKAVELLTNLASVFRGLLSWDGTKLRAFLDKNDNPTAKYSNSNVVDGKFSYVSTALHTIHTAVHISYLDPEDGYRSKTAYISDEEAIKRYGLNISSVVGFGCTSLSQAMRVGRSILETELKQHTTINFKVGAEGLRHLPYDIIQVFDNDRIGEEISGRVVSQNGSTITLDKPIPKNFDYANNSFNLINSAGEMVAGRIMSTSNGGRSVYFSSSLGEIMEGSTWSINGMVEPALYRCLSINEEDDGNTFTISAINHDTSKYGVVDAQPGNPLPTTLINSGLDLTNPNITNTNGSMEISWDNLGGGDDVTYNIELWRNGKLYKYVYGHKSPKMSYIGLPDGDYVIKVTALNGRGQTTELEDSFFTIDYNISGLVATPSLLSVLLNWKVPEFSTNGLATEVWVSKTVNNTDFATKIATLPHPQKSFTLNNVSLSDRLYVWVRAVDSAGFIGEFSTSVYTRCDTDPSPIVQLVGDTIQSSVLGSQQIADLSTSVGQAVGVATTANSNSLAASNKANTAFDLADEVSRGVGVGRNLILNPLFDTLEHWSSKDWNTTDYPNWINYQHSVYSYALKDTPVFMFRHNLNGDSGQILLDSELVDISDGKHYQASAYVAGWNLLSGVRVMVYFFDPQDNQVNATGYHVDVRSSFPNSGSRAPASHGYSDINRFQPIYVNVTAPLGAVRAKLRFQFQFQASETKDKYGMLTRPQLCEIPNTLTNMALFSAGESSSYTMKVGGYWNGKPVSTGFSMGVMGEETNFMIDAKNFVVGSLEDGKFKAPFIISGGNAYINGDVIATGTILGNHIAANQSISAPIIEGGSLDIGNGAAVINSDGSAYFNNATFKGHVEATSGTFNGTISADKIVGDVMTVHRMSQTAGATFAVSIPKSSRPRLVQAPTFNLEHNSRPDFPDRREVPAYSFRLNGSVLCSSPVDTNGTSSATTSEEVEIASYYSRMKRTTGWFAIPANTNANLSCHFGSASYVLSTQQLVDIGYPTLQVAYMSENDPTYSANLGSQVWTNLPDRYLTVGGIFAPTSSGLTAKLRGTRYVELPYNIKGIRFTYHGSDYAGNRKLSNSDVNLHLTNPQQKILIMDEVPTADTLYTKTFDSVQYAAILSPVGNSGNTITIKNVQVLTYSGRDFNTDP